MQRAIRYFVAAAGVVLTAAPVFAQVYPERVDGRTTRVHEVYRRRDRGGDRAQAVDKFTKTVHIGADGTLDVSNIAGDIIVSKGSGSEAKIDVVRTARGRDDADAKEQLSLTRVDITEGNGRAEVRERYPERNGNNGGRHNWSVTSDFTITAPPGTHLILKSVSGNLKIAGITGDVAAETVSGDVEISAAGRVTTAKSISGNVVVSDTKFDGALEASSISGDVKLQRVTARRVSIGSVSGNVQLDDVQSERVDAHTTSGNANFSGTLARSGRYELKSFSGEVRLTLSGDVGFELEASSFSGDVRSDLPITTHGTSDDHRRRRSLSGTYGDGSAVLNISTFSGSVVISKR
jgi:putative adhesin